ncbi:MAG TPA: 2-hydroxyhepta-2,4-diene-1,7-dioate isomerase, partial [Beijerinckiaceae bacterium]|nr:2-hydroxyhepta-2,4-diene-1,7-dioate isomerase [Beijerinckiaceae bacterium]
MKLVRFGPPGQEKPGLVDTDGTIRDLSGVVSDIDGTTLSRSSLQRLRGVDPKSLPAALAGARIGPCVGN